MSTFDWMSSSGSAARGRRPAVQARAAMYRAELAERAGLYYRLGYPPSRAIARLKSNLSWDFAAGRGGRPSGLADKDISEIVKSTYLRRPTR